MHNDHITIIDGNTSTSSVKKTDFNYLDRFTPKKNQKFGRGHIVRQFMSGVGVITERYVSDEDLLFYQSGYDSDGSKSTSGAKSNSTLINEEEEVEEEELNIILPVNCPCYEKSLEEYYKRKKSMNIFKRLFE